METPLVIGLSICYASILYVSGIAELLFNNLTQTDWIILIFCLFIYILIDAVQDLIRTEGRKKEKIKRCKAEKFFEEETERLKPLLKSNPDLWESRSNKLRKWKQKDAPDYY